MLSVTNSKKTKKKEKILMSPFFPSFGYATLRVVLTFFLLIATAPEVTTTIAAANEISAALLNSGIFGVEVDVGDEVGFAVEDELDITETVLSPALVTNISFMPES
jgi:hypothetical protein